MFKIIGFVLFFSFLSLQASAQPVSLEDLDASVRNMKSQSVMFVAPQSEEEKARAAYEEQIRMREAYEAEMRARQEAYRKAEEERLKALRPVNLFGNTLKIYAIINGEVITSRDMQDRANVFVATTQIPITKQNRQMVLEKVLQGAIDEKLKLQEAKKNGIKISEKELNDGMVQFAESNGVSIDEFRTMMRQSEVKESVFKSQMKAEMAWGRLVQKKASQTMHISKQDVQKTVDAITRDNQKQKFMVSEIVISKKDGEHIEDLVSNLRQDPRFELYAMQFSQSPSARNGGNLGWVSAEQLPSQLLAVLKKMDVGDVSDAITVGTDYYILKLNQKYTPGVDKMPKPTDSEVMSILQNKKMEEIANKYLKDLRNKAIIERKT